MTKSLLLKGLAGVAAVGGAGAGLFVFREDIFGGGNKSGKAAEIKKEENKFTHRELIDKAGLNCGLTDGETEITGSKDCSIKENGTISIKVGEQTEDGVTFDSSSQSAKLKGSRSEEVGGEGETEIYNGKLKFVVDSGDITLAKKDGGTLTHFQKLEQFETYEIKEVDGKFYLSRKTKADVGIKNALGLGECTLPESGQGDSNCSFSVEEKIKKIRFEGHDSGISVSGEIGLKVSSTVDTTTFPYGYRFNFTFPSEVNINGKQLKAKIPYEFKIKKQDNSNNLTLEKAWSDDNTFTKKAGLDCSGGNKECNVSTTDPKLNVKVGNQKKEGISSINTSPGKIKMETEQEGYNQGLKFSITGGDVTLGEGGTGDAITKLEELETYEITEDGGKYYLTKKTSPDDLIKTSLALPSDCKLPTNASVECNLDTNSFKAIKFEGKESENPTGSATLTISKANSTDFPFGYKFTFKTETEATIKTDTKIKANIPTDFKIKKGGGAGTSVSLSLEKAWSDTNYSLAAKVGLECTSSGSGDVCCTKTGSQEKLNVKKGSDVKTDIDSVTTSSTSKIKVEKDKEGYNQGLKFTITGGDVSLTGGSGGSFDKLEEFETYEITDEGGKYYLTKKSGPEDLIKSSLSLPQGCELPTSSNGSKTCSLTTENFKSINFDGKSSPASTGTVNLTISKTDKKEDFPLGYKFTLKSTSGDITIKATENVVKQNISTDFKIKKAASGQTPALSLEKAWDMTSLGKKVGLTCNNSDNNECTIETSGGLRVKQLTDHDNDRKQTSLKKKTSSSSNGKIKVTKDTQDYNQGFKFEIEDGLIELDGATGSHDIDKITRLEEYETYEIKEEDNNEWFLVRKKKADEFILGQLGLTNIDRCSSLKLPESTTGSDCKFRNIEFLKKVKFENATNHAWSGTLSDSKFVQLMISQASDFPLGFKFTFSGSGTEVCLPTGTSGGKVSLKGNSSGVDYKIKKNGTGTSATLTLEKNNGSSGSNSC